MAFDQALSNRGMMGSLVKASGDFGRGGASKVKDADLIDYAVSHRSKEARGTSN